MDQALGLLSLPAPDFIKMDVDGIEHFLLQGGSKVLKEIQGIIVEINDDFTEQAEVSKKLLEEAGLTLLEKRHSDLIELSTVGYQKILLIRFGLESHESSASNPEDSQAIAEQVAKYRILDADSSSFDCRGHGTSRI